MVCFRRMDHTRAFLLEEYKALRRETELYISEIRSQERYVVVSISAVWYWLIHEHKSNGLLWSIPILVCVASGLRMIGVDRHFRCLSPYIQTACKICRPRRNARTLAIVCYVGQESAILPLLKSTMYKNLFGGVICA